MLNPFSFSGRVDRRTYFVAGAVLMALKVAVDVAIWRAVTSKWTFPAYAYNVSDAVTAESSRTAAVGAPLTILLWSAVFLWFGIALTARRASDAGLAPGWYAFTH